MGCYRNGLDAGSFGLGELLHWELVEGSLRLDYLISLFKASGLGNKVRVPELSTRQFGTSAFEQALGFEKQV
jgi:hypothetical protein